MEVCGIHIKSQQKYSTLILCHNVTSITLLPRCFPIPSYFLLCVCHNHLCLIAFCYCSFLDPDPLTGHQYCKKKTIYLKNQFKVDFLATLVALHFTPVSKSASKSQFRLQSSSVAWSLLIENIFKKNSNSWRLSKDYFASMIIRSH